MKYSIVIFIACIASSAGAAKLEASRINSAQWHQQMSSKEQVDLYIKAQVLLDRARFSPGEIDGRWGDNFKRSLQEFSKAQGLGSQAELSSENWNKLSSTSAEPVIAEYEIADEDLRGPYVDKIPDKLEDKPVLTALSYTSVREKIAEQFHMSEELLAALNQGKQFNRLGEKILVTSTSQNSPLQGVGRLEVNKSMQMMKVYDKSEQLIAVFPATVGSREKPAPSGRLKIQHVTKNPTYTYKPDYQWKGVRATKPFTIKPGPNNPVGTVWIDLSANGYGIHGTPEPSKVGKAESHGCVRLTNWDVLRLADAVAKGTPVDFVGNEQDTKVKNR